MYQVLNLVSKEGFSLRDFFEGSVGREFQETEGILSTSESPITRSKLIEDQWLDIELKVVRVSSLLLLEVGCTYASIDLCTLLVPTPGTPFIKLFCLISFVITFLPLLTIF